MLRVEKSIKRMRPAFSTRAMRPEPSGNPVAKRRLVQTRGKSAEAKARPHVHYRNSKSNCCRVHAIRSRQLDLLDTVRIGNAGRFEEGLRQRSKLLCGKVQLDFGCIGTVGHRIALMSEVNAGGRKLAFGV